LKMVIPGDQPDNPVDQDLFSLEKIRRNKIKELETEAPNVSSSDDESDFEDLPDGEKDQADSRNSLVVDFDDEDDDVEAKQKRRTKSWFEKDVFADLENEEDEDQEIERMANKYRRGKDSKNETEKSENGEQAENAVEPELEMEDVSASNGTTKTSEIIAKEEKQSMKKNVLDPETMALGEMWVDSAKSKRKLVEFAYNRYTNNDDNLPDWFQDDERKHWKKQLPVTKEQVEYYKKRQKDINARPIKKVIEAKGRKRRRALKKVEQARKRAEAVVENADMSEHEKANEMRRIYKQANQAKKKDEVKYVVTRKGMAGKRVRRPAGVKGRFRLVDPRLKKDSHRLKNQTKAQGKSKPRPKMKQKQKQKGRR